MNRENIIYDPILLTGGIQKDEFKMDKHIIFSQLDLEQNEIGILDTYDHIYLWIGSHSTN